MESTDQDPQSSKSKPTNRRQLGLLSATAVVAALGGAAIAGGAVSAADDGSADEAAATTIRLAQSVETTVPNVDDPVVTTGPGDDDAHDECDFGDFGFDVEFGEDLPQEMIDEINAESAELARFLDSKGVSYTNETDEFGLSFPAPAEDDEAGWDAVDEFFNDKYGDFDDFDFDDPAFDGDFGIGEDLPQEMIDEINAEGVELAKFLDERGVSYTTETDEFGISFPEPADEDEAGWDAVDEFFSDKYGDLDDFDFDDAAFDEDGDVEPDTTTP